MQYIRPPNEEIAFPLNRTDNGLFPVVVDGRKRRGMVGWPRGKGRRLKTLNRLQVFDWQTSEKDEMSLDFGSRDRSRRDVTSGTIAPVQRTVNCNMAAWLVIGRDDHATIT